MADNLLPLVIGAGVTIITASGIIYFIKDKLLNLTKNQAPGMPPPPPNISKKKMMDDAAKIGLNYKYYNIGFCGLQGTGKSTLINALRDLPNIRQDSNWEHIITGSAPTGEIETTIEMDQYGLERDGDKPAHLRLWDLPGCGTQQNGFQDYFMNNYLYTFDCLVVLTTGTLGEYELRILREADRCKRPVVIVITKVEIKAEAKARDEHDTTNISIDNYKAIAENTSNELNAEINRNLSDAKLADPSTGDYRVFLVSAVKYRDFVKYKRDEDAMLSFQTTELLLYIVEEAVKKRIIDE